MCIDSTGNKYGVPEGLIYSFPCTTANGQYKVVEGLKLDDAESQARMKKTTDELLGERKAVESMLK